MPHHAKHHASENRKAIERSLVIAMRTQYEPRRGSVVLSNFTHTNAIVLTSKQQHEAQPLLIKPRALYALCRALLFANNHLLSAHAAVGVTDHLHIHAIEWS